MALATALGVREVQDVSVTDAVLAFLQQRTALLVLDNCEHLIEASAQLAERLLAACAGLRILATSREALQIDGERPYQVRPLAVPDAEEHTGLVELARSPAVLTTWLLSRSTFQFKRQLIHVGLLATERAHSGSSASHDGAQDLWRLRE